MVCTSFYLFGHLTLSMWINPGDHVEISSSGGLKVTHVHSLSSLALRGRDLHHCSAHLLV